MNHSWPEVEAKILDVTEEQMLPRLTELGFQHHYTGDLKAQWLVNPHNQEELRIREEKDQEKTIVMVEHKAKTDNADFGIKSLQETGFEATDFQEAIDTLLKIGLEKKGLPSIKRRVSYILNFPLNDPVRLDFDTYSNLGGQPIPEFLEIEAATSEMVYKVATLLGFDKSDCRDYWPKKLFAHYYPNEPFS